MTCYTSPVPTRYRSSPIDVIPSQGGLKGPGCSQASWAFIFVGACPAQVGIVRCRRPPTQARSYPKGYPLAPGAPVRILGALALLPGQPQQGNTMRTPKYIVLADVTFTAGPRKGEQTTLKLLDICENQGCATLAEARAHAEFLSGSAHMVGTGYSYQVNHLIVGELT